MLASGKRLHTGGPASRRNTGIDLFDRSVIGVSIRKMRDGFSSSGSPEGTSAVLVFKDYEDLR